MALYQLKGIAARNCTTKTELLWWTVVVMGRRTSPSSYDCKKFLVNVLIAVRTFFVV